MTVTDDLIAGTDQGYIVRMGCCATQKARTARSTGDALLDAFSHVNGEMNQRLTLVRAESRHMDRR